MYHIIICNSFNPKQLEMGCCGEKRADEFLINLQNQIETLGLQDEVKVKTTPCLKNCANGITTKIVPSNLLLGNLEVGDELMFLQRFILPKLNK